MGVSVDTYLVPGGMYTDKSTVTDTDTCIVQVFSKCLFSALSISLLFFLAMIHMLLNLHIINISIEVQNWQMYFDFILQGVGKNTLAVCHNPTNRQHHRAMSQLNDNNEGQELVGGSTKKGGGIYIKHRKNSDEESDIAAEVV